MNFICLFLINNVHSFLESFGQLVEMRLQLVMELYQENDVFKVLHEFLVVKSTISIYVC